MPPRVVVTSTSASGMPTNSATTAEMPTISTVSRIAPVSSESQSSDIAEYLHVIRVSPRTFDQRGDVARERPGTGQLRRHHEPSLCMTLNAIDAAVQEADAAAVHGQRRAQRREVRVVTVGARVAHVEQNIGGVARQCIGAR